MQSVGLSNFRQKQKSVCVFDSNTKQHAAGRSRPGLLQPWLSCATFTNAQLSHTACFLQRLPSTGLRNHARMPVSAACFPRLPAHGSWWGCRWPLGATNEHLRTLLDDEFDSQLLHRAAPNRCVGPGSYSHPRGAQRCPAKKPTAAACAPMLLRMLCAASSGAPRPRLSRCGSRRNPAHARAVRLCRSRCARQNPFG